jgi:hypothetical protein
MIHIKKLSPLLLISTLLLFSSCKSHNEATIKKNINAYYYNGVYFGKNLTKKYKKGIKDGCTTAKGKYKKSHRLFRKNKDYEEGWFLGRNKCKHLLK